MTNLFTEREYKCYLCNAIVGRAAALEIVNVQIAYQDHLCKIHGESSRDAIQHVKFNMKRQMGKARPKKTFSPQR